MLTRKDIISALIGLQRYDFIRAASLGGSDANGRADDVSDVDLFAFASPGAIEQTAAAIEDALRSLSPISIAYRLPMPTWHGFHQAFYQLQNAPAHLMVDWVIVEAGTPHPWLDVERHGSHKPLFDKDGLVKVAHVDRGAIAKAIERRVADLRVKFDLFSHLPPKLVGRGLPVDAMGVYHSLVLRPVVDMLRITHCPDRHDFGFRYLRDDLPKAAYERVVRWCYPAGPEQLAGFVGEIGEALRGLLKSWDDRTKA